MPEQRCSYEVLSPWAETDPIAFRGTTLRTESLEGKTVGLLGNSKRTSGPTLDVVEDRLKQRFPSVKFSRFMNVIPNETVTETPRKDEFETWLKEVDTVIGSYGD